MTPYEIIAIIFSSFALVISIPAMILSIKNLQKMAFTIDFCPKNSEFLIITKNEDNNYLCDAYISLINKSDQQSTINKITVIDGTIERDIYLSAPNGKIHFSNISFDSNSTISKRFYFKLYLVPNKVLKFKIYTNRKTFTKKIACQLST